MKIKDFKEKYILHLNEVPHNSLHWYRLNLIERNGMLLIPEKTKEWSYPKSKLIEDIANQLNGTQIGPFSSESNLKNTSRRYLVEMLFWELGISDFYPLDKSNDLDFLF